jgi:hypothetical protein
MDARQRRDVGIHFAPVSSRADLIGEMHDSYRPGGTEALARRALPGKPFFPYLSLSKAIGFPRVRDMPRLAWKEARPWMRSRLTPRGSCERGS